MMEESFEDALDREPKKAKKSVRLSTDRPQEEPSNIQQNEDDDEHKPLLGTNKLPFPKSVFFIFMNEFCERYSFYGLEAILALFLRNMLNYTETASTVIYHLFVMISYTTPLFGGIFGDSILGKFKTTVYFSIVHSIGSGALAIGALPFLSLNMGTLVTILALIVTAIGIGGIKPSVAAFGGDQFKLPEQANQLVVYFSIYYVSINFGAVLSEIFTPILRKDVSCFGEDTCYSLAFAVPAILMVLSLVAFVLGRRLYKIKPVTESVTVNTFKCIFYAIGNRKEKRDVEHWLDYASDKYSHNFIKEIKCLFEIIILLSPLVVFWSLWTQMGTTWTFQATRMDGYLTESYTIKPDQLQVTNSFLILFLVPLFDTVVYPIFAKCNFLVKAIHRITIGCLLMSLSFVTAGILELHLAKSYPSIPNPTQQTFNFINTIPCHINVTIEPVFKESYHQTINSKDTTLLSYSMDLEEYENVIFTQIAAVDYNITIGPYDEYIECIINSNGTQLTYTSTENLPQPAQVQTFLITNDTNGINVKIQTSQTHEDLDKSDEANAKCRIIGNIPIFKLYTVEFNSKYQSNYSNQFSQKDQETLIFEVEPGKYNVSLIGDGINSSRIELGEINLLTGGSYLIGIFQDPISDEISVHVYTLTKPNTIHMAWQLIQYVFLTLAEILVAVTGYHFAYEQAPESMKSTLQSVWLLTVAGGNFIIVFIVAFDIFPTQSVLFFFFAGLQCIGIIVFMILGYRYKPLDIDYEEEEGEGGMGDDEEEIRPRRIKRRRSIAESVATGVK